MNKRHTWYGIGIVVGVALAGGGIFAWQNLRGVGPAFKRPPLNISAVINTTGMPLKLPDGFRIEILAENIPGARVEHFDSAGNLWVSQPSKEKIVKFTLTDRKVSQRTDVFTGLDGPHGFVFDPEDTDVIYIAEEGRVLRTTISQPTSRTTLMTLPSGPGHSTRTLGLGPDGKLYVTIGSSCNVCREDNDKRASMWVMDRDGKNQRLFASGLRNTVFFSWRNNEIWGNDMGRDLIGDNIPPDDINIIRDGQDYGWPFCYGQRVQDKKFDASATAAERCRKSTPPIVELPAHSAPLGLTFIPVDSSWPEEYRGNLILAFHGSWNRTVPTGYKLVRLPFAGDQPQPAEDFISGWLVKGGAIGRPVDVVYHNDALYVSDDKAGVIYVVTYHTPAAATGTCRPTGCSGQVCHDKEVVTDCAFKAEYGCYATATCARQTDGQCDWTDTVELQACLTSPALL